MFLSEDSNLFSHQKKSHVILVRTTPVLLSCRAIQVFEFVHRKANEQKYFKSIESLVSDSELASRERSLKERFLKTQGFFTCTELLLDIIIVLNLA